MVSTLRRVLLVTFVIEFAGMILLSLLFFAKGVPWPQAVWQGVFTAISAFCNAGFALQSDNMISYQSNFGVLLTVSLLIIAGGLSPAFILLVPRLMRGALIPLEHRFVIVASLILLFGGTLIFCALEWRGALGHLQPFDKILNAWFHSASTRTAGFNALDISQLSLASVFITIILMFIGGSPGGTAGGIKTTTFMILLATIISTAKGYPTIRAFSRMIPARTVYLAATVAGIGLIVGSSAFLVILITQDMPPVVGLFEVVSAMGTVGLSIGGTPMLDEVGKVIIILCMFLGRVGPLTAIILLSRRQKSDTWILPHEDVVVT
jgi:trk system potassium uptake protein TrkH